MIYTISDLEQLSGIQSHTIRIWEQRYNALKPMRSQGNTRLYDDNQLKRLLNIASLNRSGLKISKICSLSDQAVDELLDKQHDYHSNDELAEFYVSRLIKHGLEFNDFSFNTLLDECISRIGIPPTYKRVIYPLLVRLGLMWRKDDICPAHEHFMSNLIRQKLFAAINNFPNENAEAKTWVLFLPEDEDHDIGLIFANYMLRTYKQKVIYLGSKVPINSIEAVFSTVDVDYLLLFMVRSRLADSAQKYIDQLSEICKSAKIHLAGNSSVIEKLKNIDHINWFKTLDEFEKSIQNPI
ncbi:MerR family transcriptional regulator [Pedobacter chinensis]|uniref:MerR family transcriptional regulator n=1 Tax=Pedobacter chinensis TaxID=2282421 RepID=A0A369Q2D4_9SPHI|nr:MerR family transcriptional regulator [Pedobacter chinensis]RDC58610.1 MerR family transcriptional regulator [Pedobacter chinensis]